MLIQKPKGTYDLLPQEAFRRTFAENRIRNIFSRFNYKEIRTPAFEKTELFTRGIGENSEIVSKQMYSFNKSEFTLKPEMTAPVVRSYLENSLYNQSPLQKLFYISNMFRSERPQAGRFREFSQFGAEAIGSSDFLLDVEMIMLAHDILIAFGIDDVIIKINTIGSLEERNIYIDRLKEYLADFKDTLSPDSKTRLETNPLRILDTKDENDHKILKDAPVLYDYLNDESKVFFENILSSLKSLKVKFELDNRLVRGFDYYTSTVFEFISGSLGAQNSVLGGGRYDTLIEQFGGKPAPAIGFAAGFERLMMILDANNFDFPPEDKIKIYIATIGDKSKAFCAGMLNDLRESGVMCETDYLNRSIKSQMKEANRLNAEYVVVIGEEELNTNSGKLKKMSDGTEINFTNFENLKSLLLNENKTSTP